MAKKRIKNKNRIEAKSENKVLHGLAGSIEEALSEDPRSSRTRSSLSMFPNTATKGLQRR